MEQGERGERQQSLSPARILPMMSGGYSMKCKCGHEERRHSPVRAYLTPFGVLDYQDRHLAKCADCECRAYQPPAQSPFVRRALAGQLPPKVIR